MLQKSQWAFTENVAKLITKASELGIKLSFGETYRPYELQLLYYKGLTITENEYGDLSIVKGNKKESSRASKHNKRLAVDFNFFIENDNEYVITYDYELLAALGGYWESLDLKNLWGGFWKNSPNVRHFQMAY
jgi:hypothetical protein